jgi:hypothetical protein
VRLHGAEQILACSIASIQHRQHKSILCACTSGWYHHVMDASVIIKSAHDGTALKLCNRSGEYFEVHLEGPNFRGATKVWDYEPAHLRQFFSDLAANWRGWDGKREWASIEGEMSLTATIDRTGHISLSVRIRSGPYPFDWTMSAVLLIEAGQLDQIAASVITFVDVADAE